ncbi:MAG: ATP synthase F0 subunit B [Holosporales bacterium]|jgi:F0F1-type ATP synthase membrane subunit b/b'|nr:ATP synthase F0 subunit B [Holosporales bacterium]
MLGEADFWVLLSFLSLVALVGKKAYLFCIQTLDAYRTGIEQQFSEAEALKKEAQELQKRLTTRAAQVQAEIADLKEKAQETLAAHRAAHAKMLEELAYRAEREYVEQLSIFEASVRSRILSALTDQVLAQIPPPSASFDPDTIPWGELKKILV